MKLSAQDVLSAIASREGVSQKDLIARFGVDRKNLVNILNALLAAGQSRTNGSKTKGRLYYIQGMKPCGE